MINGEYRNREEVTNRREPARRTRARARTIFRTRFCKNTRSAFGRADRFLHGPARIRPGLRLEDALAEITELCEYTRARGEKRRRSLRAPPPRRFTATGILPVHTISLTRAALSPPRIDVL